MAAYCLVYDSVICRLTAKNRDQLQNPMLHNRIWATFTFFKNRIDVISEVSNPVIMNVNLYSA